LTIALTANRTTVTPGGIVAYTLTLTNDGQVPYADINAIVDLSGVIDDATYGNDAAVTGGGTVTYTVPNLTWRGDIAVGAAVTVHFSAQANNPVLGNASLVAIVGSTAAHNTCPAGANNPA